jgi:hypothetical protein
MNYYPRRTYPAYKKPAPKPARRKPAPVDTIVFNGENGPKTFYRNARGRCEDAPCCGCCTI